MEIRLIVLLHDLGIIRKGNFRCVHFGVPHFFPLKTIVATIIAFQEQVDRVEDGYIAPAQEGILLGAVFFTQIFNVRMKNVFLQFVGFLSSG